MVNPKFTFLERVLEAHDHFSNKDTGEELAIWSFIHLKIIVLNGAERIN